MPQAWQDHLSRLMEEFLQAGFSKQEQIAPFLAKKGLAWVGGHGTSTTCIQVKSGTESLIIDGGSGLRNLGADLIHNQGSNRSAYHILLTHFHWDHLMGIPFFWPLFSKDKTVHFYSVQSELAEAIRLLFRRPFFPVAFEQLQATIKFHIVEARKPFSVCGFDITAYLLDHPDPCYGFRISRGDKHYAHCVDTEGTRVSAEEIGADLPLYQNADLMYFDAQYTMPELAEKANWGHSAARIGLEIALREGIRQVVFGHHDPGADFQSMRSLETEARAYMQSALKGLSPLKWQFAYDGLEIQL
jgi:phosphoribosyl 1,2-cyclic phosphodiesterase